MKLRVVDWVDYDDDYPDNDLGWAARNAVIDELRAHAYLFSGWAHQEGYRCTPLLNDGTVCRYSQRGWGDVMAEAQGSMDGMSYSLYAFMMDRSFETRPSDSPRFRGKFETDLNETFELQTSATIFKSAQNDHKIKLRKYENLRYLYIGDTLILTSDGESAKYTVTDAFRSRDTSAKDENVFVLNVSLTPIE